MEFDDECTMSDDGGVRHHLGLAKVTQGPPRVKVLCNFRGMKIPIAFPPGQIMSWPYKGRGEPFWDIQTQLKTSGLATWLGLWTKF